MRALQERIDVKGYEVPGQKRKPSPAKLAKGLERMAHEAEAKAGRLREIGLDGHARAVSAAANAFSDAALHIENKVLK